MSVGAVSVVIPTRNRADLIEGALDTVTAQGPSVGEIIVVDDGSTDGTSELIEQRARDDGRIRLLRHPTRRGVAGARNRGLAEATAPWVAFLDDDDRWHPCKIDRQLAALSAHPGARWSATGSLTLDAESGRRRTRYLDPLDEHALVRRVLVGNPIPGGGSAVLAATPLVRELGGFDTRLSIIADWDLWIRLALSAPLAPVRAPLTTYVLHARNMSNDPRAALSELDIVEQKYLPVRLALGVGLRERRLPLWVAHHHLRQGRWQEACRVYVAEAQRQRRPALLARAAVAVLTGPAWMPGGAR